MSLLINQKCKNINCGITYPMDIFKFKCECGSELEYHFEGSYDFKPLNQNNLWKYFDLIPLKDKKNIVSLGAGDSEIILLNELSHLVNGAKLYLMLDSIKNPTGTFKDREASIILSKCKEMGLDNLVFYSTANTGRAYTHYAAQLGLTSYMFMPKQCQYKNTNAINKTASNFIILVDEHYPEISPFAKKFAEVNRLTMIAPLHDRTESYATVAYEQFEKLPECTHFVQTIASGMGAIGFYKGHQNLVQLGIEDKNSIPKVICIQSSEMNVISKAYNSGKKKIDKEDLSKKFEDNLFEPTLNSTNPVVNYPHLFNCLNDNQGIITDVKPEYVRKFSELLITALENRNVRMRFDLEQSLLIEFAGLLKLANRGTFNEDDHILLLACGKGNDESFELIQCDSIINPRKQDPKELFEFLNKIVVNNV